MGSVMYFSPVLHHFDTEDIKSRSSSSSSGSNPEDSDAEADKDSREDEKTEQPIEADREEAIVQPDETDEPNPDEAAATEAESAVTKDSDAHNSAAESAEMDLRDSSVPSGNENKQSDNASGDDEVDKTVDESKQEDELERGEWTKYWSFQLSEHMHPSWMEVFPLLLQSGHSVKAALWPSFIK